MKEDISDYYKNKGFDVVYVNINKEPRRVATLRKYNTKESHTMSYSKYIYTSFYKCDIPKGDEVDHINGDKMDDRIENLQIISCRYNRIKDHSTREMVLLECPVCHEKFLFNKRNLPFKPNPCCSRRCGGIKSHWKK
jgi:hypothetical protein